MRQLSLYTRNDIKFSQMGGGGIGEGNGGGDPIPLHRSTSSVTDIRPLPNDHHADPLVCPNCPFTKQNHDIPEPVEALSLRVGTRNVMTLGREYQA